MVGVAVSVFVESQVAQLCEIGGHRNVNWQIVRNCGQLRACGPN